MIWSILLMGLLMITLARAEKVYSVVKGDTLTGIARRHGIGLYDLADYNKISRSTKVKIGQKIRIPDSGATKPTSPLPSKVKKAIDQAKVKRGRWKHIVIHHSATSQGSAAGMDVYHRKQRHMENGLAYHFVIGNGKGMPDGGISVGNRWTRQLHGGHLSSNALNEVSIGICLVGHFDQTRPTAKQLRSLQALIASLRKRCRLPASSVKTHQEINTVYTRCPGKLFPKTF